MRSINGVTFLKALTRDKFNPRISFVSLDYSHLSWSWQPCEDKSRVIQYFHVSPFYTGQERSRPALTVHHKSHVRSQVFHVRLTFAGWLHVTSLWLYLMNTGDGRDPDIFLLSTFLVSCLHAISQWGIWTCLLEWWPEAVRNHSSFLLKYTYWRE